MIKLIQTVYLIINHKTIIVTCLSIIATWICVKYDIHADLSLSMLSMAIVFPIVFAINSAYQRREEALEYLAGIKGYCIAIFLAVKHWGENDTSADRDLLVRTSLHINNIMGEIKNYLLSDKHGPKEFNVYHAISSISKCLQEMRKVISASEMSRINEYVSMMIIDFENLKIIKEYRTPITLKTYSRAFIYTFPVVFSPFFASTMGVFSFPVITYLIPVVYSFILISLINIQDHMEDPFDGIGEDDIKIESERLGSLLNGLEMKKELTEFLKEKMSFAGD